MNHNVMMAQAQAQAQVFQTRALPKKTANAPQYDGKLKDDLELYLFATEKFYSEFRDLMNANTSESVDMIFCNFGPVVRTFLREVSHSLTRVDGIRDPLTWALCKDRLRTRFRDEHVIPSFNGRLEQAQPPFPERLPKSRHLATPERLCQAPSHGGVVVQCAPSGCLPLRSIWALFHAHWTISHCPSSHQSCNGARIGQCPFQGKGMFSDVDHTDRCGPQELSVTHHDGYCVQVVLI
ncbi:hypothetical protein PR003_g7508 [Phytophthora rubi]|nr:hypothetical protein PR003_g7508 [Phytophthora rubi]